MQYRSLLIYIFICSALYTGGFIRGSRKCESEHLYLNIALTYSATIALGKLPEQLCNKYSVDIDCFEQAIHRVLQDTDKISLERASKYLPCETRQHLLKTTEALRDAQDKAHKCGIFCKSN